MRFADITISITDATVTPTRVGFNKALIFGYFDSTAWGSLVVEFENLADMMAHPYHLTATSPIYKCAESFFAQNPRPSSVLVGCETHAGKMKVELTPIVAAQVVTTYACYINGALVKFVSDETPTAAEVVTGLKAAIAALNPAQPVVTGGTTTLTIEAISGAADNFTFYVADKTLLTQFNITPVGTPAADLTAIDNVNSDWYCLLPINQSYAGIIACAAVVEAQNRILIASSADDIIHNCVYASGAYTDTDIASKLKSLARTRTALCYSETAADTFLGAGWVGKCLAQNPGSLTWKFKTVSGTSPSTFGSATPFTYMRGKNCNFQMAEAGINYMANGTMASGKFIDLTHGLDALVQRMAENLFALLTSSPKIPYTDSGGTRVDNSLLASLKWGVDHDILTDNPAPTVTVSKVATISSVDRGTRLLPDIKFTCTTSGAIHSLNVAGTVSV